MEGNLADNCDEAGKGAVVQDASVNSGGGNAKNMLDRVRLTRAG